MKNIISLLILSAACVVLVGCGGGNGGDKKPDPAKPTATSMNISVTAGVNTPSCTAAAAGHIITLTCYAGKVVGGAEVITVDNLAPERSYTINATPFFKDASQTCTLEKTSITGKPDTTVNIAYSCKGKPGPDPTPSGPLGPQPKAGAWKVGYVMGFTIGPKDHSVKVGAATASTEMIKNAISNGYNVFVYAFGGQGPDGTVNLNGLEKITTDELSAQLALINDKKTCKDNCIALLSIGGQATNNTFNPKSDKTSMTNAGVKMAEYLHENGFHGLDLDVEVSTYKDTLLDYISAFRTKYKTLAQQNAVLTAAPQITGQIDGKNGVCSKWATNAVVLSPRSAFSQELLDSIKFDAIFVQMYNQYGGSRMCGIANGSLTAPYVIDKPAFITIAFNAFTNNLKNSEGEKIAAGLTVPKETKIVLGFPANVDIPFIETNGLQNCLDNFRCAGIGIYEPYYIREGVTKDINNHPQFGGYMTWAINYDADNGYKWIKGIVAADPSKPGS